MPWRLSNPMALKTTLMRSTFFATASVLFFLVNATYICLIWELIDRAPVGGIHRRCAGSCVSDRLRLYAFSGWLRL